MLFCQLIISVLTRQSNLLDFGKAFKEFIPSSETPVSTQSRSPKIRRKIKHFAIISESRWKNSLSNCFNYIFVSRRLRPN